MYKVEYSKKVLKQLGKLDKKIGILILDWIEENLENSVNPRTKGKGLIGDKSGQWRYRIGDYRLICDIKDEELVILALSVGHRKMVYKK